MDRDGLLEGGFVKAQRVLRRRIMFALVKHVGLAICFRCGTAIESDEDLSIDHKTSWMRSPNPEQAFFDLQNIAFSHRRCNSGARSTWLRVRSSTKFKGVRYYEDKNRTKPWKAFGYRNNRHIVLGYFSTAEEAAKAYDEYMEGLLGDRAVTNKKMGLLGP